MRHTNSMKILLLVLVFTFLFASVISVNAAKPLKTVNIEVADATSTSVTFSVEWDKISATAAQVYVHQYYNNNGSPGGSTGYNLALGEITLLKRTQTYSGYKTIDFEYAQYSPIPAPGSFGRIRVALFDKNGKLITNGYSDYFLIP